MTVHLLVNDRAMALDSPVTIGELLQLLGLDRAGIAVERNLELVPSRDLDGVRVADGDRLEIVTLVGGG